MIECELECCFNREVGGCSQCTATEEEYKNEEAAYIANGQCGIPTDECPIYQAEVPPPWEL